MATGISGFLVSPSVTLTSGTKTIQITGSVDCSYVVSGTAVILNGGGVFLEGVDGTNYDLNGDSTITLRNTYTGPTLTNVPMTAFNTTEGLRDAIRRARDITETNVAFQDTFETLLLSTDPKVTVNVNGVDRELTPYQYLADLVEALVADASDANSLLQALVVDVQNLQTEVDNLEANVNAKLQQAEDAASTATTQAGIATTQAGIATTQAGVATTKASEASTSATTATTAATTATTKASEALQSEQNAAASEDSASTSATTATTQAGIATTKASEANQSAIDAEASAQAAETSRLQAATSESNAAQSAVDSEIFSDISAANANFKGEWSSLTGALSIPASVKHLDTLYILINNLADVTTSEPDGENNPDWAVIGTISSTAPDSDRLGGELASEWQLKIDNAERARQFEDHLLNVALKSTEQSLFYATKEQLTQQGRIRGLEDREGYLLEETLPSITESIDDNTNQLSQIQVELTDLEESISQRDIIVDSRLDELEALALAGL